MDGTIHLFEHLPQVDERPLAAGRDFAPASVRNRPLVGLIRNARSYRNLREGLSEGAHDGVIVRTPHKRGELPAIIAEFAAERVDYIAIDGGDGTVRDVLTCGAGVFGDAWPSLIVLPTGKTNALAHDLGIPVDWTLDEALAAARRGRVLRRQPVVVTQRDNARAQVRGFVLGGGAFTRAIALGQRSHDLGAFNAAVVGLTAMGSVVQAMFGGARNAWRRGTRMRLRGSDGRELEHHGGLPQDERYVVFASTLERLPAGLSPFRGLAGPLRLAVFDNPSRSLLLRLGSIYVGRASDATKKLGYHAFDEETVDLDIGEAFILDGEAFPPGHYCLSAGAKLRFVVP